MNLQELERLEAKAMDQTGKFLATPIAITPGQMLGMGQACRLGMLMLTPEFIELVLVHYSRNSGNAWAEHHDQNAARQWMAAAVRDAVLELQGKNPV